VLRKKVIGHVDLAQRGVWIDRYTGVNFESLQFRDHRGSVAAEYAILLTVVAVGLSLAIASLGVPLLRMYLTQQTWLLLPFP
jgi:Flp pilus assembly pilin Flp